MRDFETGVETSASSLSSVSEELISDGVIRQIRIVSAGLLAGTVVFGLVVAGFHFGLVREGGAGGAPGGGAPQGDVPVLGILSLAHAGVFLVCWLVSAFLPSAMLRGAVRGGRNNAGADPPHLGGLLTGMHITGYALREGPAFFGLVICLLGILSGEISESPVYWLNASSAVVFVLWGIATFPTRERFLDRLEVALQDART